MRLTVLRVPVADAELATDRLWLAGARAVEEVVDDARGVEIELRTVLARDDVTSRRRLGDVPPHWSVRFVDDDEPPSEAWRDHAAPVEVNPELVITPAWCPVPSGDRLVVEIEPAGSFGLGDHPTTRLSADAVWRLVRRGDRVLDAGCGSGVLSVIAAHRGADTVVAVDVSDAAIEATSDNVRRNGVARRVSASRSAITELEGPFDLVVANILAPTLIELADDLGRLTARSGRLVISGVLADAHGHVLDALWPLRPVRTDVLDGWAAVELRHG